MAIMYKENKFSIHTTHCDFKSYLRPCAALDFFQDMASSHAELIGVGYDNIMSKGYFWVVLYEQMEVVSRLPLVHEDIIVKTWPKARYKLEFEREYEMCDLDGNVLVKGVSNWVLLDAKTRMISKATDVEFDGEYFDKANYLEKQKRKLNLNLDNYDVEYKHKVSLSDLDCNMHMNNAKYADIIFNMQKPEGYKLWKKLEIAFIKEARLNEEITVRHQIIDGNNCYKGYINDEPCFEAILYLED